MKIFNKENRSISIFLIIISLYWILCSMEYWYIQVKSNILEIRIISSISNKTIYYNPTDTELIVYEGDDILIKYEVEQNSIGTIMIDRIFEDINSTIILSSSIKYITYDMIYKKRNIYANYKIPDIVNNGCQYQIYSYGHFISRWNLISIIYPKYFINQKLKLCVLNKI